MNSPLPRLPHRVRRQMRYMREARAEKEKVFTEMVTESVERVTSGKQITNSALDDILLREAPAAKEGESCSRLLLKDKSR